MKMTLFTWNITERFCLNFRKDIPWNNYSDSIRNIWLARWTFCSLWTITSRSYWICKCLPTFLPVRVLFTPALSCRAQHWYSGGPHWCGSCSACSHSERRPYQLASNSCPEPASRHSSQRPRLLLQDPHIGSPHNPASKCHLVQRRALEACSSHAIPVT